MRNIWSAYVWGVDPALYSDDGTVYFWDTTIRAVQLASRGHLDNVQSVVLSVVFSPDGLLLASGSDDGTACLWDTATGSLQHTLRSHSDWYSCLVFSSGSQLLAFGSYNKTVSLRDTAKGSLRHPLRTLSGLTGLLTEREVSGFFPGRPTPSILLQRWQSGHGLQPRTPYIGLKWSKG